MRNYLWAPAMVVIRKALIENIKFSEPEYAVEFKYTMLGTDQFHPFDYDSELDIQRALSDIPKRCDYRSCGSYHEWHDNRIKLLLALEYFINDSYTIAEDYYNEPMNFAPGYVKPKWIDYKLGDAALAKKLFRPVHRAAHGLTK